MGAAQSSRTGNLLLDAFPPDVREAMLVGSRVLEFAAGHAFVGVGDDVKETYFPTSGTLSILAEPDDESIVEAGTVGREGAADVFASLGALRSVHRMIGQVPGQVIVVEAKLLRTHALEPGLPQTLLFSYIQALFAQAAISVACMGQTSRERASSPMAVADPRSSRRRHVRAEAGVPRVHARHHPADGVAGGRDAQDRRLDRLHPWSRHDR
jgi:hypothetical protein